jgi:hypothetical protein
MTITEYQSKYDFLQNTIKDFKFQLKSLIESAKIDEFYIKNDKFKKSGKVLAYVCREAYYSRYVGEAGAMYNGSDTAGTIDDLDFEKIIDNLLFLKLRIAEPYFSGHEDLNRPFTSEDFEKVFLPLRSYFPQYIGYPQEKSWEYKKELPNLQPKNSNNKSKIVTYDTERYIKDCKEFLECITYTDGILSYRYSGESDQGELVNDSGFDIGYYDEKYIDNFKDTSYEDKFDVYCHADEVKW